MLDTPSIIENIDYSSDSLENIIFKNEDYDLKYKNKHVFLAFQKAFFYI